MPSSLDWKILKYFGEINFYLHSGSKKYEYSVFVEEENSAQFDLEDGEMWNTADLTLSEGTFTSFCRHYCEKEG